VIIFMIFRSLLSYSFATPLSSRVYSTMSENYSVAYLTVPVDKAELVARGLLEKKLVACVNIVPKITSLYTWKGNIEKDEENLLIVKTRAELVPQITKFVKELKYYDVPEVISMNIVDGNADYLKWLHDSTIQE